MIDETNVTNFKRTNDELLEFFLFAIFVRGKTAHIQAKKLDEFLTLLGGIDTLTHHDDERIDQTLRLVGAGQYNTLVPAVLETLVRVRENPDYLREATVADLETIRGVGPKTSRFFVLHSRAKQRLAVLDTHILRYLGDRTGLSVPRTTPTGKKYAELEEAFLLQADFEGVDPAAMDLAIWRANRETNHMDWRRFLA